MPEIHLDIDYDGKGHTKYLDPEEFTHSMEEYADEWVEHPDLKNSHADLPYHHDFMEGVEAYLLVSVSSTQTSQLPSSHRFKHLNYFQVIDSNISTTSKSSIRYP
jgi:hypothetical protein